MTIDGPWIDAKTVSVDEIGATYLDLVFGDPNGVTAVYDIYVKRWFASTYPPSREGQLIANSPSTGSNYSTIALYVAVELNGTLSWKRCATGLTFLDLRTGLEPDEQRPLYTLS